MRTRVKGGAEMKRVLFLMIITGVILVQSVVFAATEIPIDAALTEANRDFTYRGKPIHPGLVQEFSSWISDPGLPTTISVDVSAPHGNEYFSGDLSQGEGRNGCIDTKDSEGKKDGGSFCYERLGKLDNGLHVLETADSGGGSGVFMDLFFVRFSKGTGYTKEGEKYDRLLMSIVREYTLGDRDDGKIAVTGNKVIVGKSRYRKKQVELTF